MYKVQFYNSETGCWVGPVVFESWSLSSAAKVAASAQEEYRDMIPPALFSTSDLRYYWEGAFQDVPSDLPLDVRYWGDRGFRVANNLQEV